MPASRSRPRTHVSDGREQVVRRGNGFNNYFYNVSEYTRSQSVALRRLAAGFHTNPAAHGRKGVSACKPTLRRLVHRAFRTVVDWLVSFVRIGINDDKRKTKREKNESIE